MYRGGLALVLELWSNTGQTAPVGVVCQILVKRLYALRLGQAAARLEQLLQNAEVRRGACCRCCG